MNINEYSRAILVIRDDVRVVKCSYEVDSRGYDSNFVDFKTFDQSIKVGMFVIVPTDTRHRKTVVKVTEVDVEPDIRSTTKIEWVIGIVDSADYDRIKSIEGQAISQIKEAERRSERDEMREALLKHVDKTELAKLTFNGDPKTEAE